MRDLGKDINITINGLTVSYIDDGPEEAPVIIFIHGFPFNKLMWHLQTEALKEKYRVLAYDIRGFGNSDAGMEEFSIGLFVSDLLSLMDTLKIKQAVLCGLSMGGYIALHAIESYPERFSGLVLADTNCLADSAEAKDKRMKTIERIRENGIEKYADESLNKLFAPESFTNNLAGISDAREMILKTPEQSLYRTLHALSERKETCGKLPEISVPVHIFVGKEDIITPLDASHHMHEKIKHSVLFIIDHAGHLSNLENPWAFNYRLKKFMSSIKSI